jgi:hypothetical protein
MSKIPPATPQYVRDPKRIIVTIAIYGVQNFVVTQNEYSFELDTDRDAAAAHYASDAFRKNIEAAGAFVKVDVHKI